MLLTGRLLVGVSSCKKDEPTPPTSDRSFVTKYVKPQEFLQCDTTIGLPWTNYGKPTNTEFFCLVKGEGITPEANPVEFAALAKKNGDIGYTGVHFNNIECLSEPLLGVKVTTLEDVFDLVKKGDNMGHIIGIHVLDMYGFIASGYAWSLGTASPSKAYAWRSMLVENYNPECGKMIDPRGFLFSIDDRDFCQAYLQKPESTWTIVLNLKVTLAFPSVEISAPIVVYKAYATH